MDIILEVCRNGLIAEDCANDIAGNCSGRVAVSSMIDGTNHTCLEIVDVAKNAENGDDQCFFGDPTASKTILNNFPILQKTIFEPNDRGQDLMNDEEVIS